MIYGSVCSGIEAATVAWHPLGWIPAFFSEIDSGPCKVLAHHYPTTPNYGDMTNFKEWPYEKLDILVGGTPCQSFSVAGLRKGLDDPRGNLMLTFLAIAKRYSPQWVVWENVPGVLSSHKGLDFDTFLKGLAELGYGFAYRVLDAQHFGVPQRRRRVFVIGCLGDWRSSAAVLFEQHSLQGHTAPRREKGQEVTDIAGTLAANGGGLNRPAGNANKLDFCITVGSGEISKTLMAGHNKQDPEVESYAITYALAGNTIGRQPENGGNGNGYDDSGVSYTLTKTDVHAVCYPINTQIATRHEAMGEGTGMGIADDGAVAYTLQAAHSHAVAYSFDSLASNSMKSKNPNSGCNQVDVAKCLDTSALNPACNQGGIAVAHAITFNAQGSSSQGDSVSERIAPTLDKSKTPAVMYKMQVRRLMPIECARLQGFPDDYLSQVPGSSDSAMYKAFGNSMAVPVMKWIGERIQIVHTLKGYDLC